MVAQKLILVEVGQDAAFAICNAVQLSTSMGANISVT